MKQDSDHTLTRLATLRYGPPTLVIYYHDFNPTTGKIGWHLITSGNTTFIGTNWVIAAKSINNALIVAGVQDA